MPRENNEISSREAQNFIHAMLGGRDRDNNRAAQQLLTAAFGCRGRQNRNRNRSRNDNRADTTAETPEERALRLRAEADEKVAYLEAKEGLLRRLRAMPEGEDRESFKKDLRCLNIWIKGLEILQPATDS
ncbi:hypothetical protein LY78DRAFT_741268 [Colletotrichum sublineola]|uniref:Uncharacterized protein n=1 Tax=Colletotrichum sublineola TaxID=1173701 RepID=A0A066XLM1_COLSU|nr:hypothetical protein LY78DRAFT_741268 [Colletotrichum sublineola]KDN69807.1 hypothetical protein CSUB01_09715 [Colletotrichum sublineola]